MEQFYFGAATSSHQVEGGQKNDWTEWEKRTAERKTRSAKGNPPAGGWPDYILRNFPNPLQAENYISGAAADHWSRYEEDFDLAKKLGHNAHRFSIEWSRVEPEEGKFDEKALAHYRDVVRALRKRGMEPFVTLWHFTVPRWFRDQGGWLNPEAVPRFSRYVERVLGSLGRDVTFWVTINEPAIYAAESYLIGVWPPNRRNPFAYLRVLSALAGAHRAAYAMIKRANATAQVGIAKNYIFFDTQWKNPLTEAAIRIARGWWNLNFLERIKDAQDFIGVNYYFHAMVERGFSKKCDATHSDMGWGLCSEGLYHVLTDLARYGKPLYVTENGLADVRDAYRAEFIDESLRAVKRAIGAGADVRGYLHWSLLDNFEWADGFWPRFGLVEIDYKTLARRVRPSALRYRDMITKWPNI
ncbi:MAG: glycoside hydrolase family 1 protein [Candidatus Jorgensenbacteria bacterium]|nr:glycoside hydrolase family 1 protein [Candidatus Jorgensenbacteria bacterium]